MDKAEPKIVQVKVGWAALGNYWAVFGATREEAIEKFREAEERHKMIASRKESTTHEEKSQLVVG